MSNITFLKASQITGDEILVMFKKYGPICDVTDFSTLLGGINR